MTIAALAGLSAGCVKENGHDEGVREHDGAHVIMDFTSSLEGDYLTKTVIGDEEDVRSVSWSEGDRISIISGDGSSVTAGIGTDGSIDGVTVMQSSTYYAVYPGDTETEYGLEGLSFTIPSLQSGRFEDANYMVATASDNERHFRFRNMVSMLQIDVDSEKYDKVTIRSNDGSPLVGKQTVMMDQDGNIVSIASSETSAEIEFQVEGAGPYYVAVLADAKLPSGLGFRFYKDGEPVTGVLSITSMTAERSSIRELSPADNIVTDWYVTPDGTGNGLSESTPGGTRLLHSLLSVNVAEGTVNEGYTSAWRINGSTVHLAEGTYTLKDFNIDFKEPVSFSVEGPQTGEAVLTVENGSIMSFKAPGCTASFSNICFTGGKTDDKGGAVNIGSGNTGAILNFSRCVFRGNGAGDKSSQTSTGNMLGGAVFIGAGQVGFDRCVFDANYANLGAHIAVSTASTKVFINRSIFKNGTAYHKKGQWYGAAITVVSTDATLCVNNSVFYNNASHNTSTNDGLPCIKSNGNNTLIINSSFYHKGLRAVNPLNGPSAYFINNMAKSMSTTARELTNNGNRKYNLARTDCADDTDFVSNDNLTITWTEDTNSMTWTLDGSVQISAYATEEYISGVVAEKFVAFDTWSRSVEDNPYGIDLYGNVRNSLKFNPGAWDEGL